MNFPQVKTGVSCQYSVVHYIPGKTSILYKLVLDPDVEITTHPTNGFNVENLGPVEGVSLNVWDVGGQERLRSLWRHYFTGTDGEDTLFTY